MDNRTNTRCGVVAKGTVLSRDKMLWITIPKRDAALGHGPVARINRRATPCLATKAIPLLALILWHAQLVIEKVG